jgi:uncharacterized protein (DUF433 family)
VNIKQSMPDIVAPLVGFSDLAAEDIRACLAIAADRERKLATLPG